MSDEEEENQSRSSSRASSRRSRRLQGRTSQSTQHDSRESAQSDDGTGTYLFSETVRTPAGWGLCPVRLLEAARDSLRRAAQADSERSARLNAILHARTREATESLDPIFARLTVDTTGYEAPLVQELRLVQSMLLSWGEALEREASAAFVEEEQEEGVPEHDHHSDETRPPLPSAPSPAVGSTRRREASPPSPSEQSPTKRGKHRQAVDGWPDIDAQRWTDAQTLRTSSPVVPSQPERAQGPPTERQSKLDFAISDSI
ncbi:hypothetical protein OC842_007844, partial [Tilletia horrida]